jgi:hypothetical protein
MTTSIGLADGERLWAAPAMSVAATAKQFALFRAGSERRTATSQVRDSFP